MRSARSLFIALSIAAAINALLFTYWVALPIPRSDAWHFIDTFVRKAVEGGLGPGDFFEQRWPGDHAQPIHRLVLLTHLRLADLDFRLEAIIGIFAGLLACSLLARVLAQNARSVRQKTAAASGMAGILAVGMSLNSIDLYTWSLVSMVWFSLLVAVLYWIFAALRLRPALFLPAASLATFAMASVLDEVAIGVYAAAVGALLVRDGPRHPGHALRFAAAGAVGMLAGRWLIDTLGSVEGASAVKGDGIDGLIALVSGSGSWQVLVAPLSDSLVQQVHLERWLPSLVVPIQLAIAGVLAVLHVLFWRRAFSRERRPGDAAIVIAVAMMFLFYASVAGIALSRAAEFGVAYFHQSRYVALYQLNLLALVLLFGAAPRKDAESGGRSLFAWIAALLLLQVGISFSVWRDGHYLREYNTRIAEAMMAIGTDPDNPPQDCPPILTVCTKPQEVRVRTFAMLKQKQLSLYSARFRRSNQLEDVVAQARLCQIRILGYGPKVIRAGEPFNPQPDGRNAFWFQVAPGAGELQVEFEGIRLPYARSGNILSISEDARQAAAASAGRPLRFDLLCQGRKVDAFDVAVLSGVGAAQAP